MNIVTLKKRLRLMVRSMVALTNPNYVLDNWQHQTPSMRCLYPCGWAMEEKINDGATWK